MSDLAHNIAKAARTIRAKELIEQWKEAEDRAIHLADILTSYRLTLQLEQAEAEQRLINATPEGETGLGKNEAARNRAFTIGLSKDRSYILARNESQQAVIDHHHAQVYADALRLEIRLYLALISNAQEEKP